LRKHSNEIRNLKKKIEIHDDRTKELEYKFELAKTDGIENFDSITYRVQSCDALSFWERIGALVTGLTYIEGNISEIIEIISSKKNKSL
jgi:hypothetical protein